MIRKVNYISVIKMNMEYPPPLLLTFNGTFHTDGVKSLGWGKRGDIFMGFSELGLVMSKTSIFFF